MPCPIVPQQRVHASPSPLDRQIERLSDEIAIRRSPMVVVDGVLAMHGDGRFRPWNPVFFYEDTSTSCIGHIDGTLPSLSSQEPFGLPTPTLGMLPTSSVMHRTISEGAWRGQRRNKRLHLHHQRSGFHRPMASVLQRPSDEVSLADASDQPS